MRVLIDREGELASLNARAAAGDGQLVLVWGRRRSGKTFLLQHFAKEHRTVYFAATQQSEPVELAAFTASVRQTLGDRGLPSGYVFPGWEAALDWIAEAAGRRRLVVVIDEFPYLAGSTRGLESIVQRWWDQRGRDSHVMLILCGSAVAYMQQIAGAAAPLHQRATGSIVVKPLNFRAASLFVGGLAPAERLVAYGVLGGTPLYLEQWDDRASKRANLLRLFADPASPLVDAAELVLAGEIPETEGAFRVLQAVAVGRTRAGEIADYARVAVERPLKRLATVGILERKVPAFDDPARTKRAVYRIADPYFNFWFRFVASNRAHVARGLGEVLVDQTILPGLDDYMGPIFEEVARDHARELAGSGTPAADRVDAWWSADGAHEIDMVGTTRRNRLSFVGTAKWSARPLGAGVLANLEHHARAIPGYTNKVTKLIYSRSGCAGWVRSRQGVRCFSAHDLCS